MEEKVEIIPLEEFKSRYSNSTYNKYNLGTGRDRFCRAVRLKDCVLGTYAMPDKFNPVHNKIVFGFYLTKDNIVFTDDSNFLENVFVKLKEYIADSPDTPIQFLFNLMDYLIKDDMVILQEYEQDLSMLEEKLMSNITDDFEKKVFLIRKNLAEYNSYYEQLQDLYDTLCEEATKSDDEKVLKLFELLSSKSESMYQMVQMLKEYSLQLKEMHQSHIDIRQNYTMKVLTIVTTFVMPLTLIAGWYGMNFKYMPELGMHYGYLGVWIFSILCIVVEVIIFKKKKWF